MDRRQASATVFASAFWSGRPRAAEPADARFAALAARYFAERMDLDPLAASGSVGGARYEGRLEITIAPAQLAKSSALNRRVLRALRAIDPATLGAEARLSHELLAWELELALAGDRFPGHLLAVDQFGGLPLLLANLGSGDQAQPLKTPRDHDNYLKRLRRLPDWNRQVIANLREGVRRGVTQPRALLDAALPALRALAEPDPARSPFLQAERALPQGFPAAERQRLSQAYRRLLADRLLPAMRTLLAYLDGPYRAACRTTAGLSALPDGAAWYAWLVRFHTTTTMAPSEIHALGLAEVDRIRAEMAKVQARFGFEGSLTAFLRWHAEQPRFRPFTTWPEVVAAYTAMNARIVPQLPRLFGRAPKLALEVREMPALLRASASPYYNAPAPDGSRPGVFFVGAPSEPAGINDSIVTTLTLHEGQPGHHYQIALQYEMATLPDFRRYGWSTAFGEGWALYAETLGHELGLYEDPNQYLGHLKLELMRAVRLVVDTGLHTRGWTREQTLQYMVETEGANEADARLATERYMAVPGQALAYKIGALTIQRLRAQAQAALGTRFSLPAFHDLVLSQGTVPLQVLERLVQRWIASPG